MMLLEPGQLRSQYQVCPVSCEYDFQLKYGVRKVHAGSFI